ncbi:MAG: hypothetical protein QW524_02705 [Candidatus Woesearchaeota archaeon]
MKKLEKLDFKEIDIFGLVELTKKIYTEYDFENMFLRNILISDSEAQVIFSDSKNNKNITFYFKNQLKQTVSVVSEEHWEITSNHAETEETDLILDDVVIGYEDALSLLDEFFLQNLKNHKRIKTIFILENNELGVIWNIIVLCANFDIYNLKYCAKTGKLLHVSQEPVFDFDRQS